VQGLAWSRAGTEIWFTASFRHDRQLFGVSPRGKAAANPDDATRDAASGYCGGRPRASFHEQQQTNITGIDPATGKNAWAGMVNGSELGIFCQTGRRLCLLSGEGQRAVILGGLSETGWFLRR